MAWPIYLDPSSGKVRKAYSQIQYKKLQSGKMIAIGIKTCFSEYEHNEFMLDLLFGGSENDDDSSENIYLCHKIYVY